ncbi:MAG: hypothetical protein QXD50_01580 [Desulfurococcaceae archaeon]
MLLIEKLDEIQVILIEHSAECYPALLVASRNNMKVRAIVLILSP